MRWDRPAGLCRSTPRTLPGRRSASEPILSRLRSIQTASSPTWSTALTQRRLRCTPRNDYACQPCRRDRRAADQSRNEPRSIAITPDGRTAYVADSNSITENTRRRSTPINLSTNTPEKALHVAARAIAVTLNGETALALTSTGVVPIATATNIPGRLIGLGGVPPGHRTRSRRADGMGADCTGSGSRVRLGACPAHCDQHCHLRAIGKVVTPSRNAR